MSENFYDKMVDEEPQCPSRKALTPWTMKMEKCHVLLDSLVAHHRHDCVLKAAVIEKCDKYFNNCG